MRNQIRLSEFVNVWAWGILVFGVAADLLVPKVSAADVSIGQYGAKCNGLDDAAAVQSAFDALADGDRLLVPCRAYIGPAGIHLRRKNDVIIEGVDGGGFVALVANPEKTLLGIDYCDRCIIRALLVDSSNLPLAGININFSTDTRIERNLIANAGYPAPALITGYGNRRNSYVRNTLRTSGWYKENGSIVDGTRGIWLGNPRPEWLESEPTIADNNLFDLAATAIAVNGGGAVVTGNYADGGFGSGVKISPAPGDTRRNVVMWNTLRNNRFSGVQIESSDAPVIIRENILEQNQVAGVYVSGGAFMDGEIIGNRIAGSGEAGIYIYNGTRVLIEENDITGGGNSGIVMESQSGAIQDVRLHANTVTGVLGNGLVMLGRGGAIRGVMLNSNTFSYIRQYGLAIEEQNRGAIVNPSLVGNCFANMGVGTLLDTRSAGRLQAPVAAQSCSKAPTSRFRSIRMNVGGGQVTDSRRQVWQADDGTIDGWLFGNENEIRNTTAPELYRSGRWKAGQLEYSTTLPNRLYSVTLKFAEPIYSDRGKRIFDIYINGELVAPAFDILAYAGLNEAVDREFKVTVNEGKLNVRLVGRVENPFLCAIEIQ